MRRTVAVALVILGLASRAFASLGAVGPTHPVNGFPIWYTDGNGLKLDLCLDPEFCFFSPPIPGNPFSQQIGFGDEAFWWNADAALAIVGGGEGLLVLGLEAAFFNTEPVDGEQIVFARIRIRADLPVAGTYTVTHPFGVDVFNVTDPGQDAIKFTEDVGGTVPGDFTTALGTRIGPFLVAVNPAPPPGFVGNFNVLQTVTGSPFGTNLFRIDGPPGSNLDGNGNDFVTTNLFNLQGRVYPCLPIDVSPPSLPDGVRGDPYAATLSASGGAGPYAFSVTSGALPPGLSLAANGALSGTPTASGSYTFTSTAVDQNLCTGSRTYTVNVACGVVVILPPTLPDASQGLPYGQQLTAPGSAPWTFSVTGGAAPPGLALSSTGLLSGTPTTFGDSSFTVTATDPNACSGSRAYALHVGCGNVAVSPPALPPGAPGVPYAQTLTAAGGTAPYGFAVTQGALPPGLVLAPDGTLSGTPSTLGTFDFTVTATDPNGCPGTRDYSLLVREPMLSIGDASVVEGDAGTADASFTVSLSDAIVGAVTVDYSTSGLSATMGVDFLPASGSLTFLPPGTTPQTVHVAVVGDIASEVNESFAVTLSAPTGAVLGDGEGLGIIVNDDPLTAAGAKRELTHGSALWRQLGALPGGVPRDDWFHLAQRAHASYEVLVDATTGDIGDGGPRLERIASDGVAVVQDSVSAGAGGSRSLRWENASSSDVIDQYVRLRSAGCSSDCSPEDGCRIRLLVTTAGVARFNNSSSQATVLVLQNTVADAVSGHAWFWSAAGDLLGAQAFALAPRAALVLPTASVAGVSGASGSITVSHDGSFGQIGGKTVALEPATGFSFDTPLLSLPR